MIKQNENKRNISKNSKERLSRTKVTKQTKKEVEKEKNTKSRSTVSAKRTRSTTKTTKRNHEAGKGNMNLPMKKEVQSLTRATEKTNIFKKANILLKEGKV